MAEMKPVVENGGWEVEESRELSRLTEWEEISSVNEADNYFLLYCMCTTSQS